MREGAMGASACRRAADGVRAMARGALGLHGPGVALTRSGQTEGRPHRIVSGVSDKE